MHISQYHNSGVPFGECDGTCSVVSPPPGPAESKHASTAQQDDKDVNSCSSNSTSPALSDDSNHGGNLDFTANNNSGNLTATSAVAASATQQHAGAHNSGANALVHAESSGSNGHNRDVHSSNNGNNSEIRPSDPDGATTEKPSNESHQNSKTGRNHRPAKSYMHNQTRPLHPPPSETRQAASKDFLQNISLQVCLHTHTHTYIFAYLISCRILACRCVFVLTHIHTYMFDFLAEY